MTKPVVVTMSEGEISYRWALDSSRKPVAIEHVQRGMSYLCPLCESQMIPHLGSQVQHHFAHERNTDCTPEKVNRAVIRRWLAVHFQFMLSNKYHVKLRWKCAHCDEEHHRDLLEGVTRLIENCVHQEQFADLALVDRENGLRAVFVVQEDLTRDQMLAFAQDERYVFTISPDAVPVEDNLMAMLKQTDIVDAPCPHLAGIPHLLRTPEAIREALRGTVARFPGYWYAPTRLSGKIGDLVDINGKSALLSRERWQTIIGGERHKVAPTLEIVMHAWPQDDGTTIYLFYVTYRNTHAIAVRRYGAGAQVTMHMDTRIYSGKTTAEDVARLLVTQ